MNDSVIETVLREAKKSYFIGEIPVGCVIVKKNKILAKAHNLKEKKKSVICHAEILALIKAYKKNCDWRLDDCILVTSLFPCPMCASAIYQSRIKEIYYINDTNNVYNKKISEKILMPENCKFNVKINKLKIDNQLISNFFKELRKTS
ncbi:MAG: nucleoside deaminase [bacterium]|nr:nucleoside deaminase [bacterium]